MANISNVLDEARALLEKRIAELDEERHRLESALSNLIGKKSSTTTTRRRGPGRPRGSTSKKAATPRRRRRRRRRGGTRADQAVSLIEQKPGINASEIAKTMKIKPNYLYRVLGDLEKEGRVKKKGRQYNAA
jgi:sugar-specific transcriptional regulator TrmB